MTDDTRQYYLNSPASVVMFETLEISHISFSQKYYLVKNNANGLTATIESGEEVTFDYVPMKITQSPLKRNLDMSIKVDLGDQGDIVKAEQERIEAAGTRQEKTKVIYRTFASDNLSKPLEEPIRLEVSSWSTSHSGASFEAAPAQVNNKATGLLYKTDELPTLKGFL